MKSYVAAGFTCLERKLKAVLREWYRMEEAC